jgi:hypothetical protein
MMLLDCSESPADYAGAYYLTRRHLMSHDVSDADRLAALFNDVRDEVSRYTELDPTATRVENRQRLTAATFRRLIAEGVIEYTEEEPGGDVF